MNFTCSLAAEIEQMVKLLSLDSRRQILHKFLESPNNSERLEFQSVLESFGWKPVIGASEFTHPDYSSHYITVYPGSAIHSYAEYPWGSYGHSEYLHTPSELDAHLTQFHQLSKRAEGAVGNLKRVGMTA
jgi:hypothetical protein